MKELVKRVLGEKLLGVVDYYRDPRLKAGCGGALNGQVHRQRMVEAFVRQLPINAIVETGTYRGTTTAYFATLTPHPVYTVESSLRFYGFGGMALHKLTSVHRFNGDSRHFLRRLAEENQLRGGTVLFYLDAHWNADLPLAEELDIIFGHWERAIVLIDDFQVIDDPGYGYDDYGPGKALTLDYIKPAQRRFGLSLYFPSLPSMEETGAKRGSATVAADPAINEVLRTMAEIREYALKPDDH